jgi:hypothetical protein
LAWATTHLAAIDGVRTPMRWHPTAMRGFRRRIRSAVLAADHGPVYGYQAVNVEAQRETSSLLNWMQRMLAALKLPGVRPRDAGFPCGRPIARYLAYCAVRGRSSALRGQSGARAGRSSSTCQAWG